MPPLDGQAPAVRAALLVVATLGLPAGGPPGDRPRPAVLSDGKWLSMMRAVRRERLFGLLDRAVASGAVPATAGQAADAEEAAAQALRNVLYLERRLLAVDDRLGRDAVPFLVLKGPAVARLDEADPALRNYADVDLLVRAADVAAALSSLGQLGYRRDLPERRPGFDQRFAKEVSLADDGRTELDLHRTLALGPFGPRIDTAVLWQRTVRLRLGTQDLVALDAEGRFVHACVTAVLGDERPRLVALRDLARISTSHRLRADRLASIVPPGRGAAVVATAVATCRSTLGDVVSDEAVSFAVATRVSGWERVALRAYRAQGGSNTLELLSGAMGVRGRERLGYLRALVAPDPAYLAARRRAGRPREWSAGFREVVAGGTRRAGKEGRRVGN